MEGPEAYHEAHVQWHPLYRSLLFEPWSCIAGESTGVVVNSRGLFRNWDANSLTTKTQLFRLLVFCFPTLAQVLLPGRICALVSLWLFPEGPALIPESVKHFDCRAVHLRTTQMHFPWTVLFTQDTCTRPIRSHLARGGPNAKLAWGGVTVCLIQDFHGHVFFEARFAGAQRNYVFIWGSRLHTHLLPLAQLLALQGLLSLLTSGIAACNSLYQEEVDSAGILSPQFPVVLFARKVGSGHLSCSVCPESRKETRASPAFGNSRLASNP